MKSIQHYQALTECELSSINGGGFAYDLGFAIRFLIKVGPGPGAGNALTDYFLNYRPL